MADVVHRLKEILLDVEHEQVEIEDLMYLLHLTDRPVCAYEGGCR